VVTVALVALVGCSRPFADKVLGDTSSNLARVHSGELDLRLLAGPGEQPTADDVGFALKGPFSLAPPGGLPVTSIGYTVLPTSRTGTVKLISTGVHAYVAVGNQTYALPQADVERLRAPKHGKQPDEGFQALHLKDWVADPAISDGGPLNGTITDRLAGRARVVNALNGIFAFSRQVGGKSVANVGAITGKQAEAFERAVKSATVDILTGSHDRLLRRAVLDIRLKDNLSPSLRKLLGPLAAPRITFEFDLRNANTTITVPEPAKFLPASALTGR